MKNRNILNIISLGFALILFIINLLLCGQIIGFDQGLRAIDDPKGIVESTIILDHSGGPSAHGVFGGGYAIIAICFCIYIFAKLKERSTLTKSISLIPLGIITCIFWQMIQYKRDNLRENEILIYYRWIISSISFDWFCIFATLILIIIQLASLAQNYFKEKNSFIQI